MSLISVESAWRIGEMAVLRASCRAEHYSAMSGIRGTLRYFAQDPRGQRSAVVEALRLQIAHSDRGLPCLSWDALRQDARLSDQVRMQLAQVPGDDAATLTLHNASDIESALARIRRAAANRYTEQLRAKFARRQADPRDPPTAADYVDYATKLKQISGIIDQPTAEHPLYTLSASTDMSVYLEAMSAWDDAPRTSTPWTTLNALSGGGMQADDIMAASAPSGGAKSTFATYFAMHAWKTGKNIVYFNGENSVPLQRRREALAMMPDQDAWTRGRVRSNPELFLRQLRQEQASAQHGTYRCIDTRDPRYASGPWTAERIDEMIGAGPVDMIALDYIMLLDADLESSRATKVDAAQKILADVIAWQKKRRCFLLILSQLNRAGEFSWASDILNALTWNLRWRLDKAHPHTYIEMLKKREFDSEVDVDYDKFWVDITKLGSVKLPEVPADAVSEELREAAEKTINKRKEKERS